MDSETITNDGRKQQSQDHWWTQEELEDLGKGGCEAGRPLWEMWAFEDGFKQGGGTRG